MKIKAIAIDDEPLSLNIIENFCSRTNDIELLKSFTSPNDALKFTKANPIDLIFLDIQMPSMTGIDFYQTINKSCMAIFVSAYSNYAVEGFNLQAIDYLLKPFSFQRFMQAIDKATTHYLMEKKNTIQTNPFIFVRSDYALIKINISEIVLVESMDDYLKIHLDNNETVTTRKTLKAILTDLPSNKFLRIHRSFIVPINKITKFTKKEIHIGNKTLPIGSSYEASVFNKLHKEN